MKTLLLSFFLCLSSFQVSAGIHNDSVSTSKFSTNFNNDPFKNYLKAKRNNGLKKLSVSERIDILNFSLLLAREDSIISEKISHVQRNDMVKDVVLTTPERDIEEVIETVGKDLLGFRSLFSFLPFEDMSVILNYTEPTFQKTDLDSKIFKIPYKIFAEQLQMNLDREGDNLFQSHFTDFCGKVAVVRLWIKCNKEDYVGFMTDLYYYGSANWNGREFVTPQSVIDAVNGKEISADPDQRVLFKNPEANEKMPDMMDMVLYLTLASSFHTFPFNVIDYDADKHMENTAWAGAAINPEMELLKAMGFKVQKVGDNFRGLSDNHFKEIKSACSCGANKTVMLLVNSSMLNAASGVVTELTGVEGIEHKSFGTHWITIDYIDYTNDTISFWEYGQYRQITGIYQMKKIIAGGIIIDSYGAM